MRMNKRTSCCGAEPQKPVPAGTHGEPCCPSKGAPHDNGGKAVPRTPFRASGEWAFSDHIGHLRCRLSGFRMGYVVEPGLHAINEPDRSSDVFVSANYKLSFDILRRALKGLNAWVLVLDTKGINVWCAAGKGTFGTDELIKRVREAGLEDVVAHRRIIVPQLGAPGVSAHEVQKATGFRVYYGPVDTNEIRAYIDAGYNASPEMRSVRFSFVDRLVLTPMEIIPALKIYPLYALLALLIFGLGPTGIVFSEALAAARPFLILGLASILAGALVTPLLLPLIPFRSFAVKGWIAGMVLTLLTARAGAPYKSYALSAFTYLFFPFAASYIALQFTGSTVFTGISGVKKELRFAVPVYAAAAFASLTFLIVFKLSQWGVV